MTGKAETGPVSSADGGDLARRTHSVISRLAGRESDDAVLRAIEELEERDRQVLLLRGVEGVSNEAAAVILGMQPNAVAVRFHRARERLRRRLPESVLSEL